MARSLYKRAEKPKTIIIVILNSKFFTSVEFTLLCIALPTFIWVTNSGHMMFGFLWVAFAYTGFIWWRLNHNCHHELVSGSLPDQKDPVVKPQDDSVWDRIKTEWNWGAMTTENLKLVFIRWIIATILICVFTWFYEPERLFHIPLNMPHIIPFLVLAYPILSALPQEFIFCSFFMKRYGPYIEKLSFPRRRESLSIDEKAPACAGDIHMQDWMKILVSAIVFGYAHMLFLNWIAPVFSFFGGLMFAYTYLKTRSLALVTFEHALYGNSIFLAGIGYYFYSGGIGQ